MRRAWVLAVVAVLAGCGGGAHPREQGLVAALGDQGVHPGSPQPAPPGILEFRSTVYQVPEGELHIWTFTTEQRARAVSTRVQPDGYRVATASGINQVVDWAAPPHWFRYGREIAVYVGSSSDVVAALGKVAGAQFAGAG